MVLSYVKRFLRLYAGLFLCAVSILLAIQGGVGVTPWDVFHMGIQNITGISYGTVNILVGLCILTTSIVLGEPIGFGTLCNTLSVGYMVDFLKWLNWVPAAPNAIAGCGMMVLSLFVLAMGSFLGGPVGIGTVIGMFGIGPAIQIVFNLFHFNVRTIRHESVLDTVRRLSGKTAAVAAEPAE